MAKKKKIRYRDEKGRIISALNLSKKLSRRGLTLSDYENARKEIQLFGSKSPIKDLYKSFDVLTTTRKLEEDYQGVIKSINALPRNRGRAFLNGKRTTKQKLAMFLADYPRGFKRPFFFFYLNHEFDTLNIKVNLDGQLSELVNAASDGELIEDSFGNVVRLTS